MASWPQHRIDGFYDWSWLLTHYLTLGPEAEQADLPAYLGTRSQSLTEHLGVSEATLLRGLGRYLRGPLEVRSSTFVRNRAISGYQLNGLASAGFTSRGGAIYHFHSPGARIRNSVLWANTECVGANTVFPPPTTPACAGNASLVSLRTLTNGSFAVGYSDIQQTGYAGSGNLSVDPLFQGTGNSYEDLTFSPMSPCIDAGNPDPIYDDVAFPPSMGTVRNDMGHNGGPLAGGWLP